MFSGAPIERTQQNFLEILPQLHCIDLWLILVLTYIHFSFFPHAIALWNDLAPSVQASESILLNILSVH
jgi:hypothetical protein